MKSEKLKVEDLVLNLIVIKTKVSNEKLKEYTLKQIILNNSDEFLLQLGNGFTYVGSEFKIKLDDRYNYIEL